MGISTNAHFLVYCPDSDRIGETPMFIRIAALLLPVLFHCGFADCGQPSADWSKEPPLTQHDMDLYIEKILPVLLEMRQAPQIEGKLEEYTARLGDAGLSRDRLAMVIAKVTIGYGSLAGLTSLQEGLDERDNLSPDEMDLLAKNADRVQAVHDAAPGRDLAVPPDLWGTDEGVIHGFLFFTTMYQGQIDPDLHLKTLIDIAAPERRALWRDEIMPAMTLFLRHQLPQSIDAMRAILDTHSGEELGDAVRALLTRQTGLAWMLAGDAEKAEACFDEVYAAGGDSSDPTLYRLAALSRFAKGLTLMQRGDSAGALDVYRGFVDKYGENETPAFRGLVAGALHKVCILFVQTGELDIAVQAADKLVGKYGDTDDAGLLQYVTDAMATKAVVLFQLGATEDSDKLFDAAVAKLDGRLEPNLVMQAVTIMGSHTDLLILRGDMEDAERMLDRIEKKYGDSPTAAAAVGRLMLSKAAVMIRNGREAGAEKIYRNLLDKYEGGSDVNSVYIAGMAKDGLEAMGEGGGSETPAPEKEPVGW